MTTHWNDSLNEESSFIPPHIATARPSGSLRASATRAMRQSELLFTMEANEVFLAFLETPPDFSHCGINE